MSDTSRNRFLFGHGGMLQSDRPGLAPSSDTMKISGRSFEDLVKMSAEFAASVVFYDDNNRPDGDWTAFFSGIYDYKEHRVLMDVIAGMMNESSVDPHLALLFAFYRMLLIGQEDINALTGRQMEYWFHNVLGFGRKSHSEGTVTLFAELNRNAASVSVPKGTLFDAGKDASGKRVFYRAVNELRLGPGDVGMVAHYSDAGGFEVLEPQGTPALHAFCISCPLFGMPEAKMTIKVKTSDGDPVSALKDLPVEYTSENGWEAAGIYTGNGGITIEKGKPAPVKYDPAVHGDGFDADTPLIRFVSPGGLNPLAGICPNEVAEIIVIAEDAEPLGLENKYGSVENAEGVNPFGPDGKNGDYFNVILPYPARYHNLEIDVKINEQGLMEKTEAGFVREIRKKHSSYTYSRNSRRESASMGQEIVSVKDYALELRARSLVETVSCSGYHLKDDSCDQEKLSKEYAKSVLKLMKSEKPTEEDINKALEAGLTAKSPKLLKPVRVKYAEYSSGSVKTFFQNPLGVVPVTGDSAVGNAFRIGDGKSVLYIGISGASSEAGQISLYMQTSGNCQDPARLSWSYLDGGEWEPFGSSGVLDDTTCGLSRDGTIVLDIKNRPENGSGLFLSGYVWLRVVADNGNCLHVTGAGSHALTVEYSPESEGTGPLGEALPKDSISKPVISIPGLKSVSQPYDGHTGIKAESDAIYRRRVAENLRHKGRAWSVWDYESIILDKFSEVSYVKCLPCVNSEGEAAPGAVTICIIPKGQESSLSPSAGSALINDVRKAVRAVSSPFAEIKVVNPSYMKIGVAADIILRKGFADAMKYQACISDSLNDYLRPWVGSGPDRTHISDGDGVSDIIAFLESVPYVDVITSIQVFVDDRQIGRKERIELTDPLGILTSAGEHTINCKTSQKSV